MGTPEDVAAEKYFTSPEAIKRPPIIDEQEREAIADKPLDDDESQEIESMATIGLHNDDPYAPAEYEKRLHFLEQWVKRRRIAEAQCDADLKWFVEWGNEACPHVLKQADGTIFGETKRRCYLCWQELQQPAGGKE